MTRDIVLWTTGDRWTSWTHCAQVSSKQHNEFNFILKFTVSCKEQTDSSMHDVSIAQWNFIFTVYCKFYILYHCLNLSITRWNLKKASFAFEISAWPYIIDKIVNFKYTKSKKELSWRTCKIFKDTCRTCLILICKIVFLRKIGQLIPQ